VIFCKLNFIAPATGLVIPWSALSPGAARCYYIKGLRPKITQPIALFDFIPIRRAFYAFLRPHALDKDNIGQGKKL
jgi:hypothetical protein